MTKQADLWAYLFEGEHLSNARALSGALMQWMETSTRYTAFVETYRDKIRKKIRVTRDPESALDLYSELEAAACLLTDRRLALTYEPVASEKRRGPDYAVTYRANRVFYVEVTRLRVEEGDLPIRDEDRARKEQRILRILLGKLGQMQPGAANLLLIHTAGELARSIDLERLMQDVKARVEGKDPAFFAASRYPSPAAFYKDFLRLSGIVLWATGGPVSLWVNRQARPGLEEKVLRLVAGLLEGGGPRMGG